MPRRLIALLVLLFVARAAVASPDEGVDVFAKANEFTFDILKNTKWDEDARILRPKNYGAAFGLRSDGWIVCTAHQLKTAKSLMVVCPDGATREADGWFWLSDVDVGVVHVPDYDVPVAPAATPGALEIGETVYALGRPFEFSRTLTRGVVSGLHRSFYVDGKLTDRLQDYIQTDAQANEGSSGGPLLNAQGEVVGLVTKSLSVLGKSRPGMCFVVPMDVVSTLALRLIEEGVKVRNGGLDVKAATCFGLPLAERKRLGCAERHGVVLHSVSPAAAKKGLREDDVVLEIEGTRIATWMHFRVQVALRKPGSKLQLTVRRAGKRMDIAVEVGEIERE